MNKNLLFTLFMLFLFLVGVLLIHKPATLHRSEKIQEISSPIPKVEEPQPEPPQVETPPADVLSKTYTSYAEAVEAAKSLKRPIFLYFGAEWCGYCKKMKSTTLADTEVKDKLAKEYVPCIIDTDKDRATARKYKVSGIPAYMILSPDETIMARTSGMKSKEEFLEWLKPKTVSFLEE